MGLVNTEVENTNSIIKLETKVSLSVQHIGKHSRTTQKKIDIKIHCMLKCLNSNSLISVILVV